MERFAFWFSVAHIAICTVFVCAISYFLVFAVRRIRRALRHEKAMRFYVRTTILCLLHEGGRLLTDEIMSQFKEQEEFAGGKEHVLTCLRELVYEEKLVDVDHEARYFLTASGYDRIAEDMKRKTTRPPYSMFRSKELNVSGNRRHIV